MRCVYIPRDTGGAHGHGPVGGDLKSSKVSVLLTRMDERPANQNFGEALDQLAREHRLSDLQRRYALARLDNLPRIESAEKAGFKGANRRQLSDAARAAENSTRVQNFMAAARKLLAGEPLSGKRATPLSDEEQEILLSELASKGDQIAHKTLISLKRLRRSTRKRPEEDDEQDPLKTLDRIAEIDPFIAFICADRCGQKWVAPQAMWPVIMEGWRRAVASYFKLTGDGRAQPRPEENSQAVGHGANAPAQPGAAAAHDAREGHGFNGKGVAA